MFGQQYPRRAPLRVGLGLAFVTSLCAQGSIVAPSKAVRSPPGAVWFDDSLEGGPFHGRPTAITGARTQYAYATWDIAPPAAVQLRGVAFRAPYHLGQPGGTWFTTLRLSTSPLAWDTITPSFQQNHGPDLSAVFAGSVNLPAVTPGPWPQPWTNPVPFVQPFPFDASNGQSLVMDFETVGSTTAQVWVLEGYKPEAGSPMPGFAQGSCLHSGGSAATTILVEPDGLHVGGAFRMQIAFYPLNTPSLALNALFFGRTGVGGRVGPLIAPFPLTALGVPATPGCAFGIGDLLGDGVTLRYQSFPAAAQLTTFAPIAIPNDPNLAGLRLAVQDLALDTHPARGLELYPSAAVGLLIGPGTRVPVTRVSAVYDPATPASIGTIASGRAAVLRFDF